MRPSKLLSTQHLGMLGRIGRFPSSATLVSRYFGKHAINKRRVFGVVELLNITHHHDIIFGIMLVSRFAAFSTFVALFVLLLGFCFGSKWLLLGDLRRKSSIVEMNRAQFISGSSIMLKKW
jgi:hypothetical protein